MTRRQLSDFRRRIRRALVALVGGYGLACSAAPNEAPPLAPRPEPTPIQPLPTHDPMDPKSPAPKFPPTDAGAPGAPAPITAPGFYYPVAVADAGVVDAAPPLPPIPDGGAAVDAQITPAGRDAR